MNPSSMAFDSRNGALLIADRGEIRGGETHVLWRGVAHRLGVSVLFSKERLPKPLLHASDPKKPDPEQGLAWEQLDTASRGIDLVIGQNKPHHALRVWKTHL